MHRLAAEFVVRVFRRLETIGLFPGLVARAKPSALTIATRGGKIRVPMRFAYKYARDDYEPLTQSSMERYIRPGMTFLDIGAHIGTLSLAASRLVGPSGKVIAVEPSPENADLFEQTMALNGVTNAELLRIGIADADTTRSFNLTSSSDSNSFFDHPNIGTDKRITIKVRTVDTVIQVPLDVAKIDVEGAEILVLDGMQRTIAANPALVLWVEWMPQCLIAAGFDPMDLPRRLCDLGFTTFEVYDDANQRLRTIAEVEQLLAAGQLPTHWYANILARRTR